MGSTKIFEGDLTTESPAYDTTKTPRVVDEDDHDRFAHYVRKDALEKAIFDGVPTRALCGKLWLPVRDPSRFPVCPECKEIWLGLGETPQE